MPRGVYVRRPRLRNFNKVRRQRATSQPNPRQNVRPGRRSNNPILDASVLAIALSAAYPVMRARDPVIEELQLLLDELQGALSKINVHR
jgi:hypothetical protein